MKNENGNDRSINNIHLSLKKDYSRLISEGIKNKNFKAVMKNENNEARNLVASSCIPFAISFGGTIIGALTLGTTLAVSHFNPSIMENSTDSPQNIKNGLGEYITSTYLLKNIDDLYNQLSIKLKNIKMVSTTQRIR